MHLKNRWGTTVDPVPFLVVAATAFAACYSFGPGYLLSLDLSIEPALAGSTAAFLLVLAVAYYRLVWTYRPAVREVVPVGVRFRRLVLAVVAGAGLVVLLALPLFAA
ncbi:MAG: hypothetical protein ABEJ40_09695 [Haloarculaceae archaeon]